MPFARIASFISLFILSLISFLFSGCGMYSLSGAATTAKTIQIESLFYNTDLGPGHQGQSFYKKLK